VCTGLGGQCFDSTGKRRVVTAGRAVVLALDHRVADTAAVHRQRCLASSSGTAGTSLAGDRFVGLEYFNTLLYLAAQSTTAINITLVNTGLPVAAFIWTLILLRELPTRATVLGALLSFCGLLVILTRGQPQRVIEFQFNPGDLIMVVAVLVWGLYSVLLRRWMLPVPGLIQLAALLLCGVPLLLPFYLWEFSQVGPMPLSLYTAGAVGYTAIFASLVAYLAWNNGVKVLGPGTASLFSYLMPVFTALLGVLLLGEVLRWYHVLGGTLTFLGLLLATWEGRKR
jgi:drug/metabolite transporter (DMT)-like permease